jgi:hypothetical protein
MAALSLNQGNNNTAVGMQSLRANETGSNNTATGHGTMFYNTLGSNNSAFGSSALRFNSTGIKNSAFGRNAMYSNTAGLNNSAFGADALSACTGCFDNTAIGLSALQRNNGFQNTGIGAFALYGSGPTGNHNTALGYSALMNNQSSSNTAVGAYSLYNSSYGDYNTVVGYNSGGGLTSGDNNTIIGANVTGLNGTLSNTVIIADGSGNQRLYIDNTGKARIGDPSLTMPGTYRLYVKEGILTEKVVIAVANSAQWADYVFASDYKLMPLTEVAKFVGENHHLPNVPSANEIVTNGINLGQMDAKLLEKIEELTLYLIEQNAKNAALLNEIGELKRRMETVERRSDPK